MSDTRTRILDAGIECVMRNGLHGASMSVIAARAGVSKALLHYHFTDRAQLLRDLVLTLGTRLVERERAVFAGSATASAVDLLWSWMEWELRRGELQALLELRSTRDALVREAQAQVAAMRRITSVGTVNRLFVRLGLTPRVPADLIGATTLVFLDGLALAHEPGRDTRASFDVFLLAILSLAD